MTKHLMLLPLAAALTLVGCDDKGDSGATDGTDGTSADGADGTGADGTDGTSADGTDGTGADGADGADGSSGADWEGFGVVEIASQGCEILWDLTGTDGTCDGCTFGLDSEMTINPDATTCDFAEDTSGQLQFNGYAPYTVYEYTGEIGYLYWSGGESEDYWGRAFWSADGVLFWYTYTDSDYYYYGAACADGLAACDE